MAYNKLGTDLRIVGDVTRLRKAIGCPEKDHSVMLKDSIDHNSSLFSFEQDSLLR